MWSRIHLIPLLQAEEDRDQVRRHYADKAREKELLGTETKIYNSDRCVFIPTLTVFVCFPILMCLFRFVRPTFTYTPGKISQ
jgi:NADH dehydrogenase (ubiquinone) 1 alpha subcomplex subunit 13